MGVGDTVGLGLGSGRRVSHDEGEKLVEDEGVQVVVARGRELRQEGLSLRGIDRTLLAEGLTPRNGSNWHVQVVQRVVMT